MTKPTPAELIEAHQKRLDDLITVDEIEDGPEGETSLQLLQTVYRDRKQPLNVRVRCAVEALAHEYPRVSAVAVTSMSGQSFAEALDRAISRSQEPPLLRSSSRPKRKRFSPGAYRRRTHQPSPDFRR
jgi:hypothetical protein